jgi:hypothetical protein
MGGLFCEISPPPLVDGVLRVLPQSFSVTVKWMRIDTRTFNGHMGVGRTPWRSSQVTGILATISFPYDWSSFSGLFMGVMLYSMMYLPFRTDVCVRFRFEVRKDIRWT